jgi:beta-glucanase (GH16 family)
MLRKQLTAPTWRAGRRFAAGAVILAAVLLLAGYAIYTATKDRGTNVVWNDNFAGAAGTAPAADNWLFTTGTSYPGGAAQFGTGEIQTYTDDPANVSLDGDGHLVITATRDAGGAWRSARIETRRTDFEPATGGTLEIAARIKVPSPSQGYWPAFWMLGDGFRGNYVNWPSVGEIDIMENTGRQPTLVYATLHCGVTPGGPCRENDGLSGRYTLPDGQVLAADFHTYSIQWDRSRPQEEIRWYVDGQHFHTVRSGDVDTATWAAATDHGFFLLLNLAIGGALPGPPDASTTPGGSMVVDFVSVKRM